MSCIDGEHWSFGFTCHLEMRTHPVLPHHLPASCLLVKAKSFCSLFSAKLATKFPAAWPRQSVTPVAMETRHIFGVTLEGASHLAKPLWFILCSTKYIKILESRHFLASLMQFLLIGFPRRFRTKHFYSITSVRQPLPLFAWWGPRQELPSSNQTSWISQGATGRWPSARWYPNGSGDFSCKD